jgi:hypothetical protein
MIKNSELKNSETKTLWIAIDTKNMEMLTDAYGSRFFESEAAVAARYIVHPNIYVTSVEIPK